MSIPRWPFWPFSCTYLAFNVKLPHSHWINNILYLLLCNARMLLEDLYIKFYLWCSIRNIIWMDSEFPCMGKHNIWGSSVFSPSSRCRMLLVWCCRVLVPPLLPFHSSVWFLSVIDPMQYHRGFQMEAKYHSSVMLSALPVCCVYTVYITCE